MKIRVKGTDYEFPVMDELTTKELRSIKEHTGLGFRKLMEGFAEMEVDCIVSAVYVAKLRAGERVTWDEIDKLRPAHDIEIASEESEDSGEESNPPTSGSTGSGTSRTRGSKATSRSSRTTSTSPPETSTTSP